MKTITEVPLVESDIYKDNAARKGRGTGAQAKDGAMEESPRTEQQLIPIPALQRNTS